MASAGLQHSPVGRRGGLLHGAVPRPGLDSVPSESMRRDVGRTSESSSSSSSMSLPLFVPPGPLAAGLADCERRWGVGEPAGSRARASSERAILLPCGLDGDPRLGVWGFATSIVRFAGLGPSLVCWVAGCGMLAVSGVVALVASGMASAPWLVSFMASHGVQ